MKFCARRSRFLARALFVGCLALALSGQVWAVPLPQSPASMPQALPQPQPKLTLSNKEVEPEIVYPGGTVTYTIVLRNTGAQAAPGTVLWDPFPAHASYNGDAWASEGQILEGPAGITWTGEVGFDSSVWITFTVDVAPTYTGRLTNTAFLTQPAIPAPITLTAICTSTDVPLLSIEKEGDPLLPGAGKPLTYTLWVVNHGQPAANITLTVTDRVPSDTTLLSVGPGAITDTLGHITWTRLLTLPLGGRAPFTFTVLVDPGVPSGTVLLNEGYAVTSSLAGVGAQGDPYTLTVVTPIFLLNKVTDPDPPGSNRSFVYTLTLRNYGSLATGIVVSDTVPGNVTYLSGGNYFSPTSTVTWTLDRLASGERAYFTFSAYVGNLPGGTAIVNDHYGVSCAEGVSASGLPLTSTIEGPIFNSSFKVPDPIAMKPGGGASTLTYTIGIRNTGAGTALDAQMYDQFYYVSFDESNVMIDPPIGSYVLGNCGPHCQDMLWTGDVLHNSQVTITLADISNSFSGQPVVTNTAVISDDLLMQPVSPTTRILVTHNARLNVYKEGPEFIDPNAIMTYTLRVRNSAFTTDPPVWLTDVLPLEVTYVDSSNDGVYISSTRMVSWSLPVFSPGDEFSRTLTVQVGDYPSGTLIVNEDFRAGCPNCAMTDVYFLPVTTTVIVRGLGDSFKTVEPRLAYPAEAVVLTYTVHVVNSSNFPLDNVHLTDYFPWVQSTYNRDAVASAGSVISDIVHLEWVGDLPPQTTERITLSVVVDPWYEGGVTNTAVITHPSLSAPVTVTAVAYVTDDPVLRLTKVDTPDPVLLGGELLYTLRLRNLGQMATGLVISDTLPWNTTYVPGSASNGGIRVGDTIRWDWPELDPLRSETFYFRVVVNEGRTVLNDNYVATCAEGVWAYGDPVSTTVRGGEIYLPLIFKGAP